MPRHRSLTLRKFVEATDLELMERYFKEKLPDCKLPLHIIMNIEAVEKFLEDPRNIEFKGLVHQDFQMINDICGKGKSTLVWVYRKNDIPFDDRMTPQGLAMKLFLDHKEDFDYCYAWFCYRHASGNMSHHKMPGDFQPTKAKLDIFLEEIKKWFGELAKGKEALVTSYDEEDSTVILIKHGSYVRTIAYWEEEEVKIRSFRPANEDILFYNKTTNILSIKATLKKDCNQYLLLFARCIIGDESILTNEDRDKIYSLDPVQNGTFNWNGNEKIKRIVLRRINLKLPGSTEASLIISSEDVRKTLEKDMSDISLDSGKLEYAKFRFTLKLDGKYPKVTFTLKPPSVSDLSQKKHQEIINDFLKEQGVKLV